MAEQWSCNRPGMIASPVRVPPPMSSAASSTVTSTPAFARVIAAARPFGPAPTTIALLMSRLPPALGCSSGQGPVIVVLLVTRRRALRRGHLAGERPGDVDRDRAIGQPRLLLDRVGDLPCASLDHAERRVDALVVLDSAAPRLRLHPDDHEFARLECRLALNSRDHVLVVQVTVAEVEPDQ